MSLEAKIETLNAKIEALSGTMDTLSRAIIEHDIRNLGGDPADAGKTTEQTKDEQPKKDKATKPKKEEAKEITHDDLKQLCLAKVREDKSFKDTLKAYLDTEFGVKKTTDVPDEKVAEAYAKIESGAL